MKKLNKKAFTLIELLAVIVILAIIALIAVPVIMNIINKANKSAFKDTAYGIINAGELYFAERQLEPNGMLQDVTITLPDTRLELKGDIPEGSITITKDGKIAIAVQNGRYCITKGIYDKDITIIEDIENCELPGGIGGVSKESVEIKDALSQYSWDDIKKIASGDETLSTYNIAIGDFALLLASLATISGLFMATVLSAITMLTIRESWPPLL